MHFEERNNNQEKQYATLLEVVEELLPHKLDSSKIDGNEMKQINKERRN